MSVSNDEGRNVSRSEGGLKSLGFGEVFASKLSVSSTAEAGSARKSAFAGAIYTQGEAEEEAAVAMFGPSNFFDELRRGKSTALQLIVSGDLLRDRGASFRKVILTRIDKVS
jgi:hypothetical protein